MSAFRCIGTLSHGESRKKSFAEKWAIEGNDGAGNPGKDAETAIPVRTISGLPNGVSKIDRPQEIEVILTATVDPPRAEKKTPLR